MTNRQSLNTGRLGEISKLAGVADAERRTALTRKAGKRRVFGPLFYSTLVIAAPMILYVGALRIGELVEGEINRHPEINPGQAFGRHIQQLADANWEIRAAGVKGLRDVLAAIGAGEESSTFRGQVMKALRTALADKEAPVRAEAAEALGLNSLAQSAKVELTAALSDEDPTVRFAAARALLNAPDEPGEAALTALAKLLEDATQPSTDRRLIVNVMRSKGDQGTDAAVKALVGMLSSPDDLTRSEAMESIPSLGNEGHRLISALKPLFKAENPEVKRAAIWAAVQASPAEQNPGPELLKAMEDTVIDLSLTLALRERALQELSTRSQPSLRRCGRELTRQLDHDEFDARLAAAKLLRMIEPEVLAEKKLSVTDP
jgi:HEAT repeat protein